MSKECLNESQIIIPEIRLLIYNSEPSSNVPLSLNHGQKNSTARQRDVPNPCMGRDAKSLGTPPNDVLNPLDIPRES